MVINATGSVVGLLGEPATPKPVLFVGAGLSCEIGFPSWTQLMNELTELGVEHDRLSRREVRLVAGLLKSGEYLAAGEVLRGRIGRLVDDFLRQRFATLPHHFGSYEYLVRLPFAGIVTTNYDACIETAYAKHFGSPIVTLHPEETAHIGAIGLGEPFLLKLHGDARRGTSVLSATDYAVVESNEALQAAVASMFLSHPVVFLGYGMSDRDILAPLANLKSMYGGAAAQKIALLPSKLSKQDRARLEEDFRIDIATYDASRGHESVGKTVREAFVLYESRQDRDLAHSTADFAEIFTSTPELFRDRLVNRVEADLAFLTSTSPQWGPFIGSDPRAANIAEMLMAVSASEAYVGHSIPMSRAIQDLVAMTERGRVKSLSLAVTNIQTQALALLGLAGWRDLDDSAARNSEETGAWLLANARPDGWPRFDGDKDVSLVTTLSALTALTVAGFDVEAIWASFREGLASVFAAESAREHQLVSVLAGWASIYLHERWARSGLNLADSALLDRVIEVLANPNAALEDSIERLPYVESTGITGWRSWIHPTAAICALGLIPWLATRPERPVRLALGRCVSKLLAMNTPENSSDQTIFRMMYRVMAISRYGAHVNASQPS